jgi:hypothetical protein
MIARDGFAVCGSIHARMLFVEVQVSKCEQCICLLWFLGCASVSTAYLCWYSIYCSIRYREMTLHLAPLRRARFYHGPTIARREFSFSFDCFIYDPKA